MNYMCEKLFFPLKLNSVAVLLFKIVFKIFKCLFYCRLCRNDIRRLSGLRLSKRSFVYVVSMNSVIVDFAFFGYYCYIKCNRITY